MSDALHAAEQLLQQEGTRNEIFFKYILPSSKKFVCLTTNCVCLSNLFYISFALNYHLRLSLSLFLYFTLTDNVHSRSLSLSLSN